MQFAVLNIFLMMFKLFIWLNIAYKGSPFNKDLLLLQNPNLMTLKLIHLNLYLNFKKMICVGFNSQFQSVIKLKITWLIGRFAPIFVALSLNIFSEHIYSIKQNKKVCGFHNFFSRIFKILQKLKLLNTNVWNFDNS